MTASVSLRQLHLGEVQTLFSDPPSLNDVATDSAQAYLDLHFAGRNYSAGRLYVYAPGGPYRSVPEWVLERLTTSRPTLLVEQYHQVLQRVRENYVPGGPGLADMERLINHCGAGLLGFYAARLQAWWRAELPVNMTRWGYLSDELLELFYDSLPPPGMTQECFATLFPRALLHGRRPDRLWSADGTALRVQTVHTQAPPQMLPMLLFSQPDRTGVWLFCPASGIRTLDTLDALQTLLPPGEWFTVDAQSDPFDALAASYLQRQLQDIASLDPGVPRALEDYQALLGMITDSRRWFLQPLTDRQQYLHDKLPLWLAHADSDACIAYAQLLKALVLDRQQHGSTQFLEGIPTLQGYARDQLQTCLNERPKGGALTPDDIHLTFERVIAAAVPLPGGFIAGEVEHIEVTLTELALENLAGFAHTAKSIRPSDLSYETIKAWVTRIDVGQAYPALLKKHLIDDLDEVARRRQRFSQQLLIQLPMQALEWQIKGEHGLTREGLRRLQLALQVTAAERQSMALWPLAFKATPTSTADTVANMFIIGPQHDAQGCHLLYRPLCEPPLQEYPSLDALLSAIRQPGAVQDSVLTWIESRRQSVYAHDGFREPHVRHFLPGDEFIRYTTPAPAQLSKTVVTGDPTRQLFTAMVQALVTLADRDSVSNAEQRWAGLKQIGWLLFGTLQPLLSGPLALVGWLVQLMSSAEQDIAALHASDLQTRDAALLDVLVNLMLIIAHQATPQDVQQHLVLEQPLFAPRLDGTLPTTRIQAPTPFTAPASWANARNALAPKLQARLSALSLSSFAQPWPKTLAGAEQRGPWQGLLRVQQQWQALVRGQRFRVRMEQDRVRVISADGLRMGPWLKSVSPGHWDIDLQLRLSGGADTAPDAPEDRQQLEVRYQQAVVERTRAQRAMEIARHLLQQPQGVMNELQRGQAQARYYKALEDKVQHSLKELHMLRRLRELAPRPRYEEELSQLLESVVLTLQLIDIQISVEVQHANARVVPLLKRSDEGGDEQAHAELNQGMRALASSYERAIRWRAQEDRYLSELQKVPRFGRDKATKLIDESPVRPSLLDLQSLQLSTLWGLAIDVPGPAFEDTVFESMSATVVRARWASRSLAELEQVQASDAERIELLDSIDHIFAQTDDQIEFWRAMEPEKFNLEYLDKLQQLLSSLHQHVERDLSRRLQPEPLDVPLPKAAPSRRKKIIRTRTRDLFVAGSEPSNTASAQMTDAAGTVIGTFTQADDGVWEQASPPPAPRPDPELGSLVKTGNTMLREVEKTLTHIDNMTDSANDPASLQVLLETQARSHLWAANSIRDKLRSLNNARLAALQKANARTTEAQLRATVVQLEAAGLAARIRGTLGRVLSQDDVAFLHQQHQVRIVREGTRVALKGRREDYLQVYVVNDAHTGKALAYAHFHYGRSQGPDDHFTAAHLKTPEQVRLGRQAQAQVEAQAFARMRSGQAGRVQQTLEVRRSVIQLPLARKLFFSVD